MLETGSLTPYTMLARPNESAVMACRAPLLPEALGAHLPGGVDEVPLACITNRGVGELVVADVNYLVVGEAGHGDRCGVGSYAASALGVGHKLRRPAQAIPPSVFHVAGVAGEEGHVQVVVGVGGDG